MKQTHSEAGRKRGEVALLAEIRHRVLLVTPVLARKAASAWV